MEWKWFPTKFQAERLTPEPRVEPFKVGAGKLLTFRWKGKELNKESMERKGKESI